jgi:hypothetical protein
VHRRDRFGSPQPGQRLPIGWFSANNARIRTQGFVTRDNSFSQCFRQKAVPLWGLTGLQILLPKQG